jgi:hypothetical protein
MISWLALDLALELRDLLIGQKTCVKAERNASFE